MTAPAPSHRDTTLNDYVARLAQDATWQQGLSDMQRRIALEHAIDQLVGGVAQQMDLDAVYERVRQNLRPDTR